MNQQLRLFLAELLAELGFPRSLVGKAAGLTPRQVHIAAERDKMSKKLWWSVLKRDGFQCRTCGRKPPDVRLHVDHIVPLVRNGRTELANLQTLCERCNLGKGIDLMT